MPQFNVAISEASLPRVVEAFAASYRYQDSIDGEPNPENQQQFARRMVKEYVTQVVVGYEANMSAEAAKQATADSVRAELGIT